MLDLAPTVCAIPEAKVETGSLRDQAQRLNRADNADALVGLEFEQHAAGIESDAIVVDGLEELIRAAAPQQRGDDGIGVSDDAHAPGASLCAPR